MPEGVGALTPETFIKAELAAFAQREAAHHGGIDNMLAVAFVVRNRVRASWFGGNWMEIIEGHEGVAGKNYPRTAVNLRDIHFRMFLQQIDDLYLGLTPDKMTEGALYYCELNHCDNEWFLENIVRKPEEHPRVATVGNVSFFK